MANVRNDLFDCAKGIGIVLVVFGHVERGLTAAGLPLAKMSFSAVDSVIYSFHMPFFFFVSGYFFLGSLARRGRVGLVYEKARTILYPYVLWSLIQGLTEVGLSRYTNGSVSIGQILALPWQPRAQFWFLYALFGVVLFSTIVYRQTTARWAQGMLLLGLLLYWSHLSPMDIYLFNSLSQWFVYFAAGVAMSALGRGWFQPVEARTSVAYLAVAIFIVAEGLFHWRFRPGAAAAEPLVLLGLALSGIALLFALARLMPVPAKSVVAYVGRHSMEIYLLHILAGSGVRIALTKVLHVSDVSLHLMAGTLAGVLVPLLVASRAQSLRLGWLFSANGLARRVELRDSSFPARPARLPRN